MLLKIGFRILDLIVLRFWNIGFKFTTRINLPKTLDQLILVNFTKYFVNVLKITKYLVNVHKIS